MYQEILIATSPGETRVAVLEDHALSEVWVERANQGRMVGDIYLGMVQSVLPGMDAAFIDLGLERSGFLHATDMVHRSLGEEEGTGDRYRQAIDGMLSEGHQVLVQVVKEPVGTKGPRLTTAVSLPGRYAVIVPAGRGIGVSRRIQNPEERIRLRDMGASLCADDMGLIIRTMAEGISLQELADDIRALRTQWNVLMQRRAAANAPFLLHKEEGVGLSVVRDTFGSHIDRLVVDDAHLYRAIMRQLEGVSPILRDKVEYFDHAVPLFDYFGVEEEVAGLFERVVRLPLGGTLVIEQTEALVVIDVNTGRYSGGQDQEETIVTTNLQAADEIARQLRLRDLGGIIVIDFIDMETPRHRDAVVDRLRRALERDRAHTRVLEISELGIAEMTRERIRPSLVETMLEPCRACGGTGRVMSLHAAALRLDRAIREAQIRRPGHVRLEVTEELQLYLAEHWGERWGAARREFSVSSLDPELSVDPGMRFRVVQLP